MTALLVFMVAYVCGELGTSSLFRHPVRVFLKDYGTPLTLVFFTGFVHIGRMSTVHLERLPTSIAFEPTSGRGWLVKFWDLSVGEVFTALPFAILLTILFWFDHNGKMEPLFTQTWASAKQIQFIQSPPLSHRAASSLSANPLASIGISSFSASLPGSPASLAYRSPTVSSHRLPSTPNLSVSQSRSRTSMREATKRTGHTRSRRRT